MERDEMCEDRHLAGGPAIEKILIEMWKEVLQLQAVNAEDNFLLLGGESLLATQASVRLQERYGWDVSLRSVLVKTITEIAADIVSSLQTNAAAIRH